MFESVDFAGKPLTKDYAERRARFEVLQEMMQTKGNSETHPLLSPNDEFANFGIAGWEYGNLTLEGKPLSREMMPTNYLRPGLLQGLMHEQKLGVNPFKFGFIGGTDVHNSLTSIEEDNFYGKHVNQEPSPNRWEHVSKKGFGKTRYNWHYTAAGYAAVWATENTREALWDAMKRKEVYATSGTRMTVRLFGGWDFTPDDARTRYLAEVGYAKGVPMGGDLPKAPASGQGADLPGRGDEGCASAATSTASRSSRAGSTRPASRRRRSTTSPGATRRPASPARTASCRRWATRSTWPRATWTNTIGAPELVGVWKDPAFDPALRAFYYARVIEIPTPRWTAYDAGALRHQDAAGGADEAPGARLDLADLVHAWRVADRPSLRSRRDTRRAAGPSPPCSRRRPSRRTARCRSRAGPRER